MLTHIGVLTLEPTATDVQRDAITGGLAALAGRIDGLVRVRTATDLGLKDGNADVVFLLDFDSRAAWEAYVGHPAHKALIAEAIAPVLQAKVFAQVAGFDEVVGMTGDLQDYEQAGLHGRLDVRPPFGLVVVDPARAYTDPGCPLYAGVEAPVEVMRDVLGLARAAGLPVVVTRVEHDPAGRNGGIFVRKVPALRWFAPDSPYSGYIEGLAPRAGDIEIVKQYPSAFANTSLAATLSSLGVRTLFIAGLTTSGCIRATATDAMQSGFLPVVIEDAVGDRLPGPHEANLFDIRSKIGEVFTSAEVARLIEDSA